MANVNTTQELINATMSRTVWSELSYKLEKLLSRYARVHEEYEGDTVHVQIMVFGAYINFEIINHAFISERGCDVSYSHGTINVA